MPERQQDLIRRPDQIISETLQATDYFSGLSLGDIYGPITLKPGIQIVTDIPNDDNAYKLFKDNERLRRLAERHGIPHIAGGSYGGDRVKQPFIVISAGIGPAMTNWAPYVAERGAIAALATSISGNEKPVVLEIGAGNGFTSKLLAADNNMKVIATDPILSEYEQLPDTPGDITLRDASVFDLIEEFGPARSTTDILRIKEILEQIRSSFMEDKNMYYWGMQHGFFRGMGYGDFNREVAELRQTAGNYREQSPVDIVICNFMTIGDDLTLAIRDGIRPKAILYAMPLNDLCGVGNYYAETRVRGIENRIVSFNPGNEYRTAARWQTFWQDDWSGLCYFNLVGMTQADVVVQLRNDVIPTPPKDIPVVQTYSFDRKIAESLKTSRKSGKPFKTDFYRGVIDRMDLLQPKVSLPYGVSE